MIYTNDMLNKKSDKKKKRKKILKIICLPINILIILIVLYVGYSKFLKKEDNISFMGYTQYIILTGSMEPEYNVGDLIIVKSIPEDEKKLNDVITYVPKGENDTISHRLIEIEEKEGKAYYTTKGDNNNTADSDPVEYSQIKGKVVFKISKIGIVITEFTTGTGILILVLIGVFSYIREDRKEGRRLAREEAREKYNFPRYKDEENLGENNGKL